MSIYVTRNATKLYRNGQEFRFASLNTPNLHLIEKPWQPPSAFEQLDALYAIAALSGQVTRTYTISIPRNADDKSRHIVVQSGYGTSAVTWKWNEELMQAMDNALDIAQRFDVYIIIPLIDRWEWVGGIQEFANMFGLGIDDFFINRAIRDGWVRFVSEIISRNSSVTGKPYREHTSLLAWETGNELSFKNGPVPSDWTISTCELIKSIDINHLVIDGTYGKFGWESGALAHPCIDIYSNHYYLEDAVFDSKGTRVVVYSTAAVLALLVIGATYYNKWRKCKVRLIPLRLLRVGLLILIHLWIMQAAVSKAVPVLTSSKKSHT